MTKPKTKSKIIESLIITCKADANKVLSNNTTVFDQLNDKSNAYLEKLLKLANAL